MIQTDTAASLKRMVSYFDGPITNLIPSKDPMDLGRISNIISGDSLKEITSSIRSSTDAQERQNVKKTLPYFTPNGVFASRKNSDQQTDSGVIHVDIDKLSREDLDTVKAKIFDFSDPVLLFVSPSGNGLKVFYNTDPLITRKSYFPALQGFFQNLIGVSIDLAVNDISRACFLTYDPNVYYNEVAGFLDKTFIDKWTTSIGNQTATKQIPKIQIGNRHDSIMKAAASMHRGGSSKEDALSILLFTEQPGFAKEEIASIVNSIYSNDRYKGESPVDIPSIIKSSRINPLEEIEEPPAMLSIEMIPICTPGNFSMIIGKAKSRKTFVITSIIATLINGKKLLGFLGNLNGKTVCFIDTEQSTFHCHRTIKRICLQAGIEDPKNFSAHNLRAYSPSQRLDAIEHIINTNENLGILIIDGVRDLLSHGINDESEATMLTSKILKWTAEKQCHIILVLHQNKGDSNARGHIGTELTNKAETVLSVMKNPKNKGISTIHPVYCRDEEFEPFNFIINDQGVPESTELLVKTPNNKIDTMQQNFEELFAGGLVYSYNQLVQDYKNKTAFQTTTAKNHISTAVNNGFIQKTKEGKYKLALDPE